MPAEPAWFQRLPEMSDTLKGIDTDHLDRQPVERFFRVRERRALQIMIRALARDRSIATTPSRIFQCRG